MSEIAGVHAREVLDSRGRPTVEVDVTLADGSLGRASVPSGASTGRSEALELRDGDERRYRGKGVLHAVRNVNEVIGPELRGQEASDQQAIDARLRALDGTPNKERLGANALLGVSLAVARAAAQAAGLPLYHYLGGDQAALLPLPMVNILSGGLHAGRHLDLQDYLAIPIGARTFSEALEMVVEVFQSTGDVLRQHGFPTGLIADEGGHGPVMERNVDPIEVLVEAFARSGMEPWRDVVIALDTASSHFYDTGTQNYHLQAENRILSHGEMVDLLAGWVERYPILSIEDGMAEDDWAGWRLLTERLGQRVQLLGDDLFTTNSERIRRGIVEGVANSVLIKPNQIGTLSETLDAVAMAREADYLPVVSARSGDTEDDFIADLAVATGAGQIKVGSITRSERLAKYNQLLRIEEELGSRARFAGREVLGRFLP